MTKNETEQVVLKALLESAYTDENILEIVRLENELSKDVEQKAA